MGRRTRFVDFKNVPQDQFENYITKNFEKINIP